MQEAEQKAKAHVRNQGQSFQKAYEESSKNTPVGGYPVEKGAPKAWTDLILKRNAGDGKKKHRSLGKKKKHGKAQTGVIRRGGKTWGENLNQKGESKELCRGKGPAAKHGGKKQCLSSQMKKETHRKQEKERPGGWAEVLRLSYRMALKGALEKLMEKYPNIASLGWNLLL